MTFWDLLHLIPDISYGTLTLPSGNKDKEDAQFISGQFLIPSPTGKRSAGGGI